jgi:ABC-2 type transport system ATP-binding protein
LMAETYLNEVLSLSAMDKVSMAAVGVSTSYKGFMISRVSFQLKNGDILGLVGRSGSGKSTLIKTMIGLKKMDAGSISAAVNGSAVSVRTLIGYSPQENSLFPFLTVEENIITFSRLYKLKSRLIWERMEMLLARLDLQNARKKKVFELSGGMQKRVDLAVSLIHAPPIIILDEPFIGLDVSLQKFIWQFLRELADKGKIIIISSHMLNDIQVNCNKFGLIASGVYYDTAMIKRLINVKKEKDMESFLEKIFDKEMMAGK